MSEKYNPQEIEPRWQTRWAEDKLYRSEVDWSKPKHYALTMLPYPSGDLHIGHWFAMTPSDARARYMRMKGYNVLFPMGFDAFGLPAENAAVQRGIHPAEWTLSNVERMRGQLRSMGAMFDWEREAVSCLPEYYRWTEWFFKRFYEHGLAYRKEAPVNWSESLQTVLANEQVIDGKDERTGQPVIQKMMEQWFFRMTKFADELLNFEPLDWPDPIKTMQTNWIGRSEGAHVTFKTEAGDALEVFTTRPDTLWGATFMVLAPEHPLVEKLTVPEQREAITAYAATAAHATEIERTAEGAEKTGVFTGSYAINPVNQARIPIWIADYVLITYGSGAIMAVPAHDERDFAFARKYGLEVRAVIQPTEGERLDGATMAEAYAGAGVMDCGSPFDGTVSNDQKGRKNPSINAVIDWLAAQGIGKEAINYRLRDWLISRQRYWGSPIPMVYTQNGTIEPVADSELPVRLPDDVKMTGVGNPLARHDGFVQAVDASNQPARRETDTMDTFMCSSWYQYRYLSPTFNGGPFDPEEAAYWLPVDVYTGGAEHATMHLLYTRFFTKAMRDLGMFDDAAEIMRDNERDPGRAFDEPMLLLRNQGQILGEERDGHFIACTGKFEGVKLFADSVTVVDAHEAKTAKGDLVGEIVKRTENLLTIVVADGQLRTIEVLPDAKITIPGIEGNGSVQMLKHHLEIQRMSKSKGNVVNPDELVKRFGADTVRAYLMFAFDWAKGGPWDSQGIKGVVGWLGDVWEIIGAGAPAGAGTPEGNREVERRVHQAIERVGVSMQNFSFNTAVAELMKLKNAMKVVIKDGGVGAEAWNEAVRAMLLLMAPIAPHMAEELWAQVGGAYSIHQQSWPEYDPAKAAEDTMMLIVQIGKKVVDRIPVAADVNEADAVAAAMAGEGTRRALNGAEPRKLIFIPGRIAHGQISEPKINIVV